MKRFTLNNGVELRPSGSACSRPRRRDPRSPVAALEAGYRHIDTAAAYGNERQVGEAIASPVCLGPRSSSSRRYGSATTATTRPCTPSTRAPASWASTRSTCSSCTRHCPASSTGPRTYRALETLLADGKVRAIGVSNFMVEHLTTAAGLHSVVPAVNQIEVHPYFAQREVQAFGEENGILTQAWSPIGGITFYREGDHRSTLEDPVIGAIADAHGKSPAQVMLRWGLQQGRSVIPKSTIPTGSPRTSTSSTSSSVPTSWPRSMPSTPACVAGRNRPRSP